jgi:hypothetical protein
LDLVRCIATARIVMPRTVVRLSAGRLDLSSAEQALAFMAGANSIFDGDKLLTTPNNDRWVHLSWPYLACTCVAVYLALQQHLSWRQAADNAQQRQVRLRGLWQGWGVALILPRCTWVVLL